MFLFHKRFFVVKEGSSDYKKDKKEMLKDLWLNGSLWNQKWFFYGIAVKNILSTFTFRSVPHIELSNGFRRFEIYSMFFELMLMCFVDNFSTVVTVITSSHVI